MSVFGILTLSRRNTVLLLNEEETGSLRVDKSVLHANKASTEHLSQLLGLYTCRKTYLSSSSMFIWCSGAACIVCIRSTWLLLDRS